MKPEDFYLSNSKMQDWETMCPREWKAKHVDLNPAYDRTTPDMRWGQIFETMVIGAAVGGHVIEANPTEKKSVYYERVSNQAKECRKFLKLLGGRIASRQEYIYTQITDNEGQVIKVCGGLDIRYDLPNERALIIDLKLTGDTANEFGKFAWGKPESMDLSQSIHYPLLYKAKYGMDADFQYWVFDKGTDCKKKLITVEASEIAVMEHVDRLSRVYNEIMMSWSMDDWTYKNDYENCSTCKVKCNYEKIMPDFYPVTL